MLAAYTLPKTAQKKIVCTVFGVADDRMCSLWRSRRYDVRVYKTKGIIRILDLALQRYRKYFFMLVHSLITTFTRPIQQQQQACNYAAV